MSLLDGLSRLDRSVFELLHHADSTPLLHEFAMQATSNPLVKGVPLGLLFWWAWFSPASAETDGRPRLLATLGVAVLAIALGRALATMLPFRLRPGAYPELRPPGMEADEFLETWSSFPSDHALLTFTLGVGIFLVNRRAGIVALLHAGLVVSLARVLTERHWPGDVLVGGAIGALLAAVLVPWLGAILARRERLMALPDTRPHWVYAGLFLLTYEFATMFNGTRALLGGLADAIGL